MEESAQGGRGSEPAAHAHERGHERERDDDVLQRLRSVEGHVRGIARMVERDAYCVDVVHQILATQRALEKVRVRILDRHLHTCVTSAIRGDDADARERAIQEVLQVVQASGRT